MGVLWLLCNVAPILVFVGYVGYGLWQLADGRLSFRSKPEPAPVVDTRPGWEQAPELPWIVCPHCGEHFLDAPR